MTTDQKALHVIELRAENIKRLRTVAIKPSGNTVLIGGENGQGKSSCLDAIEMALSGARAIPLEPIRHGARKARIIADLGEMIVERTFTSKGTALVVRGKDGLEMASPQKLLDGLCAKVTFDPFSFARMDPKQQDELLKKLLGLDFSDLEAARKKLYDQRADANKEVKRLDALLESADWHPEANELVDVAALTTELQTRSEAVSARAAAIVRVENMRSNIAARDEQIARLERELEELTKARSTALLSIDEATKAIPLEPAPISDIQEKLRTAEATNAKVRANLEHKKLEKQAKEKADEAEEFTAAIASLDEEKAERLSKADFPIVGLGFDDAGPTFNGVPLAQASQAERLRLSVAIGAALNPRLKVMLIREGSLLDDKSLALLSELAEQTGAQIWIERVSDRDPGAIILEDGMVRDAPEAETNAQAS